MTIQQAKEEITHTLRAYLARDEWGQLRIPHLRQRPVLLMGPPGIGKTQIMEQIARECGVGLVAYTITHHTRQSAVGLPLIETRTYQGQSFQVTSYTMSEILASVYQLMERTGLREGILFLDEINCVSETLAPMMLQFLQYKTFGNQALPEGWLIVAAGNPPEYNRAVRELDMVTMDRVRRMDVEADYDAWKQYALQKGLHGAIVSYLSYRRENFYRVENTEQGLAFVTARGWEDLSELLYVYESLDLPVDSHVAGEYLQMPAVARDFASYLQLYKTYGETYQLSHICEGHWDAVLATTFRTAPFDEKLAVLGLLLARVRESVRAVRRQDELLTDLHGDLRSYLATIEKSPPTSVLQQMVGERRADMERAVRAHLLDKDGQRRRALEIAFLEAGLASEQAPEQLLRARFEAAVQELDAQGAAARLQLEHVFAFLEQAVGQGQEMVLFVTELTAGEDTAWFIATYGCEAYFQHNRDLLVSDAHRDIARRLSALP